MFTRISLSTVAPLVRLPRSIFKMCPNRDQIDTYYKYALELTKKCGTVVQDAIQGMKNIETKLGDWDLVTEYDKRVEDMLIKSLTDKFPDHKFIGEETTCSQKLKHTLTDAPTWIIDPIDGTTNFVHGFPITCISVALAVGKQLEVGIVYNPVMKQMFTARRGQGAFLNGERIWASKTTELSQSLVAHELSYARIEERRNSILERTRAIVSEAHGIRSLGSAALTLCYVAMGGLDAYHVDELYPWDMSAGVLLIKEAGGCVMNSNGSEFDIMKPNIVCGGTRELCNQIVGVLKQADKRSALLDNPLLPSYGYLN